MNSKIMTDEQKIELFKKTIYTNFSPQFKRSVIYVHLANACEYLKQFDIEEDTILDYIDSVIANALEISKNNNPNVKIPKPITDKMLKELPKKEILRLKDLQLVESKSFVIFINLQKTFIGQVTKKNISLGKKLVTILSNKPMYHDTMYRTILLHPPVFFHFVYKMFSPLIEPETRQKIIIIKKNNTKNNDKININSNMNADDFCNEQIKSNKKNFVLK